MDKRLISIMVNVVYTMKMRENSIVTASHQWNEIVSSFQNEKEACEELEKQIDKFVEEDKRRIAEGTSRIVRSDYYFFNVYSDGSIEAMNILPDRSETYESEELN